MFGQGLWFGERMPNKSLLNPNQCRSFGISLCDDPTDAHRELGIYVPSSDLMIPMTMNGSICSIMTRCPTHDELDSCRHILLSDEHNWNPDAVTFNVSSLNGEIENTHLETEFDTLLSSCGGSPRELVQRAVAPIRVNNNKTKSKTSQHDGGNYIPPSPFQQGIDSIYTSERHHKVTPESLSRKWHIGLNRARATIKCTNQLGIRSALYPLTRRYRTDLIQLKYRRLRCTMYTDTIFPATKSLNQMKCCQIWTDGKGYVFADPLLSKKDTYVSLNNLIETVGIPETIFSDGAKEEVGPNSKFTKRMQELHISSRNSEAYSQWQNCCENTIGKLKARWKLRMVRRRVPSRLWDRGLVWEAEIMSRMASGVEKRTAMERLTGDTNDISEWTDFEFYDLVWYWDAPYMENNPKIGRWLGVAHRVGSALCYWILKENGQLLSRSTVQHMTKEDTIQDENQAKIRDYHMQLNQRLDDTEMINVDADFDKYILPDIPNDSDNPDNPLFVDNPEIDDILSDNTNDAYDGYINAELLIPDQDGNKRIAKVKKKVKGNDGKVIGNSTNNNPMLDTSEYLVELPDGSTQQYAANVIAENLFSQIDNEGHRYKIMSEITDHKSSSNAIGVKDGFNTSHNGRKVPKITTIGWTLLVEWKDESSSWVPLKDLKISNPIELAEYAVANKIDHEPAFNWWVQRTLKIRHRIVNKVKSKYWDTTHKFGIRLPKTVTEALYIDKETGTTFWADAIHKEMKNVRPAFEKKAEISIEQAKSGKVLVGYQQIRCHWIFDIKMDGLCTRKARLVAGGHTTNPPSSTTYSSVVSRDSVRIAFLIAALHELDIWAADIGNAYLNAPCREKIWTVAGTEFGEDKGCILIVVRALYGLKTSGASWRAMFSQTLKDMGFESTKADPDVYIRPATKPVVLNIMK